MNSETSLQLIAGSVAGVIADGVTHPIDTVRANLQFQKGFKNLRYTSTASTFVQLAKERALYRGFLAVMMTTIPAHALYFGGYEIAKKHLLNRYPKGDWMVHLASGFFADVCASLIWVPADVIKQRVQLSADASSSAALRRVLAEDGVRGLFRGYGAGLATYGPFVAIYFMCYEKSKSMLEHHNLFERESVSGQVISGSLAAIVASGVTNPLDVIKTRVQIENKPATLVLRQLLREEGPSAFSKGLMARMSWIAPSCAIGIVVYEQTKAWLGSESM